MNSLIKEVKWDTYHDYCDNTQGESSKLKCLYLNARSLRNKMDDLETLTLQLRNLDVIVVAETWFKSKETDFFNLSEFSAFHVTRCQTGGGVSIFVSNKWETSIKHTINRKHSILHVMLTWQSVSYNIIGVYNPHKNNTPELLIDLESILFQNKLKNCFLIGDFNINLLDSSTLSDNYISLLRSYSFTLCNKRFPTRVTDQTETLIDHIHTNIDSENITVSNICSDFSDHSTLVIDVPSQSTETSYALKEELSSSSYQLIDHPKLNNYFLVNKFYSAKTEINGIYEDFSNYIEKGVATCLLQSRQHTSAKSTKRKPWVTQSFLNILKIKDRLYAKSKGKFATQQAKEDYKSYSNYVTNEKRKLQTAYYSAKFNDVCDQRLIWKGINEILRKSEASTKPKITKLILEEEEITGSINIANALNSYFTNIPKNLADELPTSKNNMTPTPHFNNSHSFFLKPTNETEILEIIKALPNKNNKMDNCLTTNLIKKCSYGLCSSITTLINSSFSLGAFPDQCKVARVVPIFKEGDVNNPSNYRPISILPPISKIIERVMKVRLLKYLESHSYFYSGQYGFRPDTSTTSAAVDLTVALQGALDDHMLAAAVFIDLKKAFDTVDHKILLQKLENAGIRGFALEWFRSYLNSRTQFIEINGIRSSCLPISYGVPQGSILGPLLFLIYINDIGTLELAGKISLFADDTVIYYKGKSEQEIIKNIQKDMLILFQWLIDNKLTLNKEKTMYMFFHKPSYKSGLQNSIMLGDWNISRVTSFRYLGLFLDSTLSWDTHIEFIKNKITPIIGVLFRLRHAKLPTYVLKSIYHSLIHSHLSYMNMIWGCSTVENLRQLEVLQNRAVRIIFSIPYLTPMKQVYSMYKIIPLCFQISLSAITHTHKIKYKLMHTNLSFSLNEDMHAYNTRFSNNIHITHSESVKYGLHSILSLSIRMHNTLPSHIELLRMKKELTSFKKKVKDVLWQKYLENPGNCLEKFLK